MQKLRLRQRPPELHLRLNLSLFKHPLRLAEQQINDYIKKFQHDFDSLLKERETKEAEVDTWLTFKLYLKFLIG
jgi:hypothetical protein